MGAILRRFLASFLRLSRQLLAGSPSRFRDGIKNIVAPTF
jgi:hypothetical protein